MVATYDPTVMKFNMIEKNSASDKIFDFSKVQFNFLLRSIMIEEDKKQQIKAQNLESFMYEVYQQMAKKKNFVIRQIFKLSCYVNQEYKRRSLSILLYVYWIKEITFILVIDGKNHQIRLNQISHKLIKYREFNESLSLMCLNQQTSNLKQL